MKPMENILDEFAMTCLETNEIHEEVNNVMRRIEDIVGHELYMKIEDDISFIMHFYEIHGFKVGFRARRELEQEIG